MKEADFLQDREQWMRDKSMRYQWNKFIEKAFKDRPCVFGTLVYPRMPHLTDIPKSVRIFTEQVLRRSSKSHPEPLRRVFVAEQTPGEAIGRSRVRPIPMNGEIRHVLIKQPQRPDIPVMNRMPDIPHIHFLMEVPNGVSATDFVRLCEERWCRMNPDNRKRKSRLAKVELVADLSAVARYITKEYVGTQGERGGSGWLDSLFPFLSGASRVADYAAVSRVVRLS